MELPPQTRRRWSMRPPTRSGNCSVPGRLAPFRTAGVAGALCYALAWRGKVVNARQGRLKNILTPLGIQAIEAAVYKQDSWYDGDTCIVLDYSKTSFVARMIRDEIREIAPGVFLGLVFWGRRHVLDFALDFRPRP